MKIFSAEKIPVDTWALKQMTKDPDNPFNIVLSTSASPTLGFDKWDPASLDVLKTVAEAFKKRFGDSPMALTMENQVVQIEQAYTEYQTTQEGGLTAPEIELKDPNGKLLKLSSLRGKVVLIDFGHLGADHVVLKIRMLCDFISNLKTKDLPSFQYHWTRMLWLGKKPSHKMD